MSRVFNPKGNPADDIYPDWQRRIDGILADPAASNFLKGAIRALDQRDPVDAAIDAELLAAIFRTKMEDVMGSGDPEDVADLCVIEHRSDDV